MSYPQVRYRVFNGTDNNIKIKVVQVSSNGTETALDTTAVTRALLTVLATVPVSLDSQDDSSLLSWDTAGVFTAVLGGQNLEVGNWKFRLLVTDSVGTNHQLVHETEQDALIEVTDSTIF